MEHISSRELTEWMAYAQMEPFGEDRADLRQATICAVTANVHGAKAKTEDFMLKFDKPEASDEARQNQTVEWMRMMGAAFGGGKLHG